MVLRECLFGECTETFFEKLLQDLSRSSIKSFSQRFRGLAKQFEVHLKLRNVTIKTIKQENDLTCAALDRKIDRISKLAPLSKPQNSTDDEMCEISKSAIR